jgi:hypothetical protein
MSRLEEEYFAGFTTERLKAARKKISKEQKENHGDCYVTRIFKGRLIKMNRRKIDKEIRRREEENNTSQNP